MRILLLSGGLYLLAVAPMAAQEASDSTRILAVPASTPAAPNLQQLYIGVANAASGALSGPGVVGIAGAALMGLCLCLALRAGGNEPSTLFRNA